MAKKLHIKNWGPLIVQPDKDVWGKLGDEAINKIKKHLESLRKEGITREDFLRDLEQASRPKPEPKVKGKRKTSE